MSTKRLPKPENMSGFRTTKREPDVLNALHKLWGRMAQLQEARKNEKEAQAGANDSNSSETLSDIQYRLLEIQLKYIQKIVSKQIKEGIVSDDEEDDELDTIPVKLEKETQTSVINTSSKALGTSNSLTTEQKISSESASASFESETDSLPQSLEVNFPVKKSVTKTTKLPISTATTRPTSSHLTQGHYHMKLNDVPFLIGKSTSASHSVIANVQNVIGMMKVHNKGLCKSPSKTKSQETMTHRSAPNAASSAKMAQNVQELKRMMKCLTDELSHLTMEQEALRRRLNHLQLGNEKVDVLDKYNSISRAMETKAKDIVVAHNQLKKIGSGRPSENVTPKIKAMPKGKARPKTRTSQSPSSSKTRILTGSTGQRFIKSVQQLKTHLQKEDLVWT